MVNGTASTGDDARTLHRQELVTAGLAIAWSALIALPVLWNLAFDPLRMAFRNGLYGDFFDAQAEAILDGRLDVPRGVLGIEAFVVDGKNYMYFGPWPALLRLPFRIFGDGLYGRLTAPSMLIAWLAFAIATAATAFRVRRAAVGTRPLRVAERRIWAAFIVVVTAGSPILLLLAIPWVFSEALLWAAAGTMAVLAAALGVLARPSGRRIAMLALAMTAAALSRVTAAWPAALMVLAVAVVVARTRPAGASRRRVGLIVAAGLVPLLAGAAVNMAKFGHPVSIPFEDQVWTEVSARRREVLADGGVVSARFLPTTLVTYARPDAIRFTSVFPHISAPASAPRSIGGPALDLSYRMPSVATSMPALVVLGVIGTWQLVRRRIPSALAMTRVPVLGAALVPAGVLLVGYLAPRYLAEFVPFFAIAGAVGLTVVIDLKRGWKRRAVAAGLGVLAVFGLAANAAIALWTANVRAGDQLTSFVSAQLSWSRLPLVEPPPVEVVDSTPPTSEPDSILVLGDCVAAYYGTGDDYLPWQAIWLPHLRVYLRGGVGPDRPTTITLVDFVDGRDRLDMELDGEGRFRLELVGSARGITEGGWHTFDDMAEIEITGRAEQADYFVDAPGYLYATSPGSRVFGDDVRRRPITALPAISRESARALGLEIQVEVIHPPLCEELMATTAVS